LRVLLASALMSVGLIAPPAAFADADPASDVLLAAPVYYPFQFPTAPGLRKALEGAIVQLEHKDRVRLKVAIIAHDFDLGGVPNLWEHPQAYVNFLSEELSFNEKQSLLVVMPAGLAVANVPHSPSLAGIAVGASAGADGLARSAIKAVVQIARANGTAISEPRAPAAKATGGPPAIVVFGAPVLLVALAALAAARLRPRSQARIGREDADDDGGER
jgi:hypothetical protein